MGKRKVLPGTYIVDKIVKKRKVNGKVELLVSWRGYSSEDSIWAPLHHLLPKILDAFLNPEDATSLQDNPRKKNKKTEASSTEEVDQTNKEQKAL